MSQENVEIIRKMYEGFALWGSQGMFEFMDPEVNHRAIEGAPDDIGVFSGYDAMRRYYGQWVEMFEQALKAAGLSQ